MLPLWTVAILLVVAILVPRVGLLARWRQRADSSRRAAVEDALKHLLEREYRGHQASFNSLAGVLRLPDAALMSLLSRMEAQAVPQLQRRHVPLLHVPVRVHGDCVVCQVAGVVVAQQTAAWRG